LNIQAANETIWMYENMLTITECKFKSYKNSLKTKTSNEFNTLQTYNETQHVHTCKLIIHIYTE